MVEHSSDLSHHILFFSFLWLIILVIWYCSSALTRLPPSSFCPMSPSFSMSQCMRLLSAHMAPRGSVGAPYSFSKQTNVLQSGGSCCKKILGAPKSSAAQQQSKIWLKGHQANMLQMALLFTCLHIPSPNNLNLLGSAVPFPAAPWQLQATEVQLSHDVTMQLEVCRKLISGHARLQKQWTSIYA